MRSTTRLAAAALICLVGGVGGGQAEAAGVSRCPATYAVTLGELREIEASYALAEAQGRKAEACAHAQLYLRKLAVITEALETAPAGCPPVKRTQAGQYYTREGSIWRAKTQRTCASAPTQHRIIKVPTE